MTELSLPASPPSQSARSGYAAGRRRSPGALAAALALNGGAFAIVLLMPATRYIIDKGIDTPTHWIDIEPEPPANPVKPVAPKIRTQPANPVPQAELKPFVQDPILPLAGNGPAIGGTLPDLGTLGGTGVVEPPVAPHKPLFVKAAQDPRYARAFHPDYPPALRREGLEGSVTVRVTIDETGRVSAVELVKATNPAFFEETREQALRFWRFKPATSDGMPVESQQILTVQFHLEDE